MDDKRQHARCRLTGAPHLILLPHTLTLCFAFCDYIADLLSLSFSRTYYKKWFIFPQLIIFLYFATFMRLHIGAKRKHSANCIFAKKKKKKVPYEMIILCCFATHTEFLHLKSHTF
jgi:hypothetical protein